MKLTRQAIPGSYLLSGLLILIGMGAYSLLHAPSAASTQRLPEAPTPPQINPPLSAANDPITPPAIPSETRHETTAHRPHARSQALPPGAPRLSETAAARADHLQPATVAAYQALAMGLNESAQASYRQALTQNPRDRDALIGLASLARQAGQTDAAQHHYEHLLHLDPQDHEAFAGLALLHAPANPALWEARLRQRSTALAHRSPALLQAWAHICAMQSHWSEAQMLFFRLASQQPTQARHLFNLAVSLEHLGKYSTARNYYRQAMRAEETTPGDGFNPEIAQARLLALEEESR